MRCVVSPRAWHCARARRCDRICQSWRGCILLASIYRSRHRIWYHSRFGFLLLKNNAAVEEISVGVVAIDFEHFGDETASRPALHLDDHIERIADVGFNGAVRQLDAALQDTACKTSEALPCGVCVNRRQRPGMARVQ